MNGYFIETIGFSASHTITDVLGQDHSNYVMHGSRNAIKRTQIGIENQSLEDFIDAPNKFIKSIGIRNQSLINNLPNQVSHRDRLKNSNICSRIYEKYDHITHRNTIIHRGKN